MQRYNTVALLLRTSYMHSARLSICVYTMILAAFMLLQINNLCRGKGAKAVGYEVLERRVKIKAKHM